MIAKACELFEALADIPIVHRPEVFENLKPTFYSLLEQVAHPGDEAPDINFVVQGRVVMIHHLAQFEHFRSLKTTMLQESKEKS